jgi:hypothetical protein
MWGSGFLAVTACRTYGWPDKRTQTDLDKFYRGGNMLNLYPSQQIEGLTVFGDDYRPDVFYVMPDQPSLRIDEKTQKPTFKFIKYKMPVSRLDGKRGGGFVIFDSVFVVSPDKLQKIQDELNQQLSDRGLKDGSGKALKAQVGMPTFTKGTSSLTLLDSSGILVTKIDDVGKPSLFGSLICSFTAELSPEGATLLEAVLKGSGGAMQIAYDLHFAAALPPITGRVWFYASKFYSFYQSIDKDDPWLGDDSETQTLRESFMNSQAGGVFFDFTGLAAVEGDPNTKKLEDSINNWGWSQLDEAIKTAILPDIKAAEDRGDDDQDHITKMQSTWESSSFNRYFTEKMGIDFETVQQGTLPTITDMGFKWQDYFVEVDLNDPFFAQITASVAVNADFDKFGIDSVDVQLHYDKSNPPTVAAFHFTKPDDVGHFVSDTLNGDLHYTYSFTANYKDESQAYQSPVITTEDAQITINVGQLGILWVNMLIGSVDFTKTPQVQVGIRYSDPSNSSVRPISEQFTFDQSKKTDSLVAAVMQPVNGPYQYQLTYILPDGTQYVTDWTDETSSQLHINSPFVARVYSFLAEADFANSVDNIFLKMKYTDAANGIEQDADYQFSGDKKTYDWKVNVIGTGKGQVTYSGVINYKNHTTESIPETTTSKDLIEFGPPNQVIVTVAPDLTLIDFTKVKLIKLSLEYADATNNIDIKQEFVVKQGPNPQPWTFYARDPKLTSYTWQATYYMDTTPPSVVQGQPTTSSDSDLVLMMPAAA